MITKYNYVFYNINEDFLEPCFMPLRKYPFVKVFRRGFDGPYALQRLFDLHWSGKVNARIRLPFKDIWFSKMCRNLFRDNKAVCYVFAGGKYITQTPRLYSYIKSLNPDNKCIIWCGDLISKKKWDLEKVRKMCDFIVTYDEGEALRYGITFIDEIYYDRIMDADRPETFDIDVYFLGYAKDRLDEIHRLYFRLKEGGLRCLFIVCGVPKELQIDGSGIHYQNPISYEENIRYVLKSRCILEVLQGNAAGATLRMKEAQVYRRRLLTTNRNLVNMSYYQPENMSVIGSGGDIDFDFIKRNIDYDSFAPERFDPLLRIRRYEALLNEERS